MLAQTIDRPADLVPAEDVFVITNAEQREAVLEVSELDPDKVIGEPVGRYAAAVGYQRCREDPEAIFAMLPADAVIHDVSLHAWKRLRRSWRTLLATIGITASFPATGWLHPQGNSRGDSAGRLPVSASSKSPTATAQSYLDAGDYFERWHVYLVGLAITAELEKSTPTLWQALQAIDQGLKWSSTMQLAQHYPAEKYLSTTRL